MKYASPISFIKRKTMCSRSACAAFNEFQTFKEKVLVSGDIDSGCINSMLYFKRIRIKINKESKGSGYE